MKTKIYIALFVASFYCTLISCSKKDETEPTPANQLEYDGTKTILKKGAYIDFGPTKFYGTSNTHLNYDFYITDGNFIKNSANELTDIRGKIILWFWLESPSANTSFKTGTYTYIDDSNDASLTDAQLKTKYENKMILVGGTLYTNTNANISIDDNSTQEIDIKSGTAVVSGTKPNYTITYDLVLDNNKTVKGSYNGAFEGFVE